MTTSATERDFEQLIERSLTGTTYEESLGEGMTVQEAAVTYGSSHEYAIGEPTDFDMHQAIDKYQFWQFLEETQSEELEKLQSSSDWKARILTRLDKKLKQCGIVHVLRRGLSIDDANLSFMYPTPTESSSEEAKERFEKNNLSVTRQVHYNVDNPAQSVDMVLFLNGLPIVTLELKNRWTNQTARYQGRKQFVNDRDTRQPLFQFGRCVVHMTLDSEEVYMTTKVAGRDTFFLPFNKGHNNGPGNPPNPNGHRTAFLWEEVFTKKSLINILEHFVRLDGTDKTPLNKRTLFFPRFHQLDVVRKLLADVKVRGVGRKYLIQHSAGSGKSNSITWAAYQLIDAASNDLSVPGARPDAMPLFDSVIVVTDRTVLDKQLRDNIKQFGQVDGVVVHAERSADLKVALESGKRIIITTIQKFPYILDSIGSMDGKQFAIIIDEAHSSQTGTTAAKMNAALGDVFSSEDSDDDVSAQDFILAHIRKRKMLNSASYFAFTATPKESTLERFGEKQDDGTFKPFHLYSMRQAIEEGFILDVLNNYTRYQSYYQIQKSIDDNPMFDSDRAQRKLKAFVERNPKTIAAKAELMVEHFMDTVVARKKLKGQGKAMILTQSIESAINYFFAVRKLLEERNANFKALVAFSGTKKVNGVEYTEAQINGFSEQDLKDKFDTGDYRILVVANKYLTGFDQPKLCAMYVDKGLKDVLAVQALSRLNRSANRLAKKKEDVFVLDFFNDENIIKQSFDKFYTSTSLMGEMDVNILHDLKETLDESGVYFQDEVSGFAEGYFQNVEIDSLSANFLQQPEERFKDGLGWEYKDQADFKIKAKQFVKVYGQLVSIIPFENVAWEELFWFLKHLIPNLTLIDPNAGAVDDLLDSVDLSSYGIERTRLSGPISLDASDTELDPVNPTLRGIHQDETEMDALESIIEIFNDRWFHGWEETSEDQRVRLLDLSRKIQAHKDFQTKVSDNPDKQNRGIAFEQITRDVMNDSRRKEVELWTKFTQDEAFRLATMQVMQRIIDLNIAS